MNHSRQREKTSSKISKNSDQIRPHPPDEPPTNASKRSIQSQNVDILENKTENSELDSQLENISDDENNEAKEENNDNLNNIDSPTENEKEVDNSWLNELPPVIHPDEELHQELLKQRHEERLEKVTSICHCELEAILNFSFACINRRIEEKEKEKIKKGRITKTRREEEKEELERYEKARQIRVLRTKFRNGLLTPEIVVIQRDPELLSTIVGPFHTLSIQHYLHYQSSSYFPDLSCAFNISLSDSHLEDPNPFFNDFIQKLFGSSEKFTNAFGTIGSLKFPFIVCVGGPPGGGRTTVAQFIQKVFDVHVIQLKQIVQSSPKKQKKGAAPPKDAENSENLASDAPSEYLLKSAIQIKYSDDKTAIQQITQEIKSNMDGRGFIIDGFPNNNKQFAALEKELSVAGVNMKSTQDSLKDRIISQRPPNPKAQIPSIDGLIIALNNEENQERLIDPETGNIYKPGFNMPGLPDLIGVSPIQFPKVKNDIEERLVKITVPEIKIIPPKQLQTYTQFEGAAKKTATCITINHCKKLKSFIESIDQFILSLFSKLQNLLPHQSDSNNIITQIYPPFCTLMKPSYLLLPHQCYNAIVAWYNCLNSFGMPIATQSNLAHTLDDKLGIMMEEATERYQLLIGQKDERLSICDELVNKNINDQNQNYNLPQLFRTIWDISLKIRNKNLKRVDEVVGKSGLIELLLELKEAPKLFFIALVKRMLYVKWYYETFQHLIYGKPAENQEENKNQITEEETVNEPQNPPENNDQQQEKEPEINIEIEEPKSKSSSRNSKRKTKDNKKESDSRKSSRLSKKKTKEDTKKSTSSRKSSRNSKRKGKKGESESGKEESSQNLDSVIVHEEEEEEPFLDKLTRGESEIPDFIIKVDPQVIELRQQQKQQELLLQQQQQENEQEQNENAEDQKNEENQSQNQENTENSQQTTGVPSINLPQLHFAFRLPHSARPVHPPDSTRRDNFSSSSSNTRNSEVESTRPHTQRANNRKITISIDKDESELKSEVENRMKERKMNSNYRTFEYLIDQLHEFCESTSKISDSSSVFDIEGVCEKLGIEPIQMNSSFDNISKYAEEFFGHISSQIGEENLLLSNEVNSNIATFRRFMNLCNSKENSMVNAVFDLRDSLTNYTYAKCTHEMENFARQFRKLKQILNTTKIVTKMSPKNSLKRIPSLVNNSLVFNQSNLSPKNSIKKVPPLVSPVQKSANLNSTKKTDQRSPRRRTIKPTTEATTTTTTPTSSPRKNYNQTNLNKSIEKVSSPRLNHVKFNENTLSSPRPNNRTKTLAQKNELNDNKLNSNEVEVKLSFSESIEKLGSPLFEFDVKHVIGSVKKLAELELSFETPIVAQDLVSSDTLLRIAQYTSQLHLLHVSGVDMLQAAKDVIGIPQGEEEEEEEEFVGDGEEVLDENEKSYRDELKRRKLEYNKFRFCMEVFECVERFDVLRFLLCLAHSRDEELLIMEMFQKIQGSI